jgi:hypothetical protein
VKIPGFVMFLMGKKQEKKTFSKFSPFSAISGKNSAKILPQICTAAYIFTQPLLSYASEESASWVRLTPELDCIPGHQRL